MFDIAMAETLSDLIKAYRARTGDSQEKMAHAMGVSSQTISNAETGSTKTFKRSKLQAFAQLANIPFPVVEAAAKAVGKKPHPKDQFDEIPPGIDITQKRKAKAVPEFNSGIAANPWIDKFPEETGHYTLVDEGDVVHRIMGDCMAPKFSDGDRVVFSRKASLPLQPGRSYYLQLSDERATFKRVFVDEDDTNMYILRCWNRKKYPKDMHIHRDLVSMMMLAISKIETIDY